MVLIIGMEAMKQCAPPLVCFLIFASKQKSKGAILLLLLLLRAIAFASKQSIKAIPKSNKPHCFCFEAMEHPIAYCFCFPDLRQKAICNGPLHCLEEKQKPIAHCFCLCAKAKAMCNWLLPLLRSNAMAYCALLLPRRGSKSNAQRAIAFASKQCNGLLHIAFLP